MNIHSLTSVSAAILFISSPFAQGGEIWLQDFAAAQKQAAAKKQDLLLDFTGSDWCGACILLRKTILTTPAFEEGVKDKFVLVELDFPRNESKQTPELLKQNKELQKRYCITAFPTVLLCDEDGRPYAATVGVSSSEPTTYVAELDELRGKRNARDKAFAEARAAATGPEKARMLNAALKGLGLEEGMLYRTYATVVEEILKDDPSDPEGLGREAESKKVLADYQSGLSEFFEAPGIHNVRHIGDVPGALAFTNRVTGEGKLLPDDLEWIAAFKATSLLAPTNIEEAIRSLDEFSVKGLGDEARQDLQDARSNLVKRKDYQKEEEVKKSAAGALGK